MVRGTVEDTLNALLDAEADRLCNAQRYERSAARRDTRAGHYERGLQTKAGEVRLRVPKLRQQTFETAIIERYRRRESSVEEALIEMYLAGVSVRRIEDITEALWGTRVSPSTVSDLNKKIYGTIDAWRNRPIEGEHPYVYLDGNVLKRSWAGEVRNVSLLVAIGVNESRYREILGICEGVKEDKSGWSAFLKHLKERGLKGIRLITALGKSNAGIRGVADADQIASLRLAGRGISRFPCNELPHMPGSSTTPGPPGARAYAPVCIAFRLRNGVSTRNMNLCGAQWLAYVLLCRRSLSPSQATAHGSWSMWIATPSSYRTCTDYSLPVSRRTAKDSVPHPPPDQGGGRDCATAARLYRHRRAPKPAGGPGVPMHAAARGSRSITLRAL